MKKPRYRVDLCGAYPFFDMERRFYIDAGSEAEAKMLANNLAREYGYSFYEVMRVSS